jgi:hypothetical protein
MLNAHCSMGGAPATGTTNPMPDLSWDWPWDDNQDPAAATRPHDTTFLPVGANVTRRRQRLSRVPNSAADLPLDGGLRQELKHHWNNTYQKFSDAKDEMERWQKELARVERDSARLFRYCPAVDKFWTQDKTTFVSEVMSEYPDDILDDDDDDYDDESSAGADDNNSEEEAEEGAQVEADDEADDDDDDDYHDDDGVAGDDDDDDDSDHHSNDDAGDNEDDDDDDDDDAASVVVVSE